MFVRVGMTTPPPSPHGTAEPTMTDRAMFWCSHALYTVAHRLYDLARRIDRYRRGVPWRDAK